MFNFQYLLKRFREPSSWTAVAVGLATYGVTLPTSTVATISIVGSAVATVLGVLLPESAAVPAPAKE